MNPPSPLLAPGVAPFLDGKTPVFVEVGADPTAGAGLALPIGSIAKFGTTYYLKTGAAATAWSTTFGGGAAASTGWDHIETLVISGADKAEQAFAAALDGDTDLEYLVKARVVHNAAANGNLGIKVNGNALVYSQFSSQDGANPTGSAAGQFGFFYQTGSSELTVRLNAARIAGVVRSAVGEMSSSIDGSATNRLSEYGHGWYTGVDNITAISVFSSQAAGLKIGSELKLYRWVD